MPTPSQSRAPSSSDKLPATEKIYLDTFVFMDILSGNPEFVKKAVRYLDEIAAARLTGVVSAILLTELAFHIRRRRGREKAQEILYYIQTLPHLIILPVTPAVGERAGLLRARYLRRIEKKLTYFDCIHLATALEAGCTKFVTGDRGFRDVQEIPIEIY